ncbi:hypothetical protein StrepF001_09950 [Streptomyces sp. F001]|nr:hypothetical protein StrepF001_09950 [Streptomyces sp. F001]
MRPEGRLAGICPGQAPFFCVWKEPGFFAEYDTDRFFVCWWYILVGDVTRENERWFRGRRRVGPRMVRILLDGAGMWVRLSHWSVRPATVAVKGA